MKKGAVLAFIVVFALCLFHFYFAEDHCPVHCPARAGGFGHVHPHHPGASVCLCFWSSLMGQEADDLPPAGMFLTVLAAPDVDHVIVMAAVDITPPPKTSLV